MKKVVFVALILIISIVTLGAVQVGTDQTLAVYGKIGAGALGFSTSPATYQRIDLINDAAVQPDGAGVTIGTWDLEGTNQTASVAYSVTYTYGGLIKVVGDPNPIAYQLLVVEDANAVKASGEKTLFTAPAGTVDISRTIKVRLTAAGVTTASTAAASNDYSSTITLALATE